MPSSQINSWLSVYGGNSLVARLCLSSSSVYFWFEPPFLEGIWFTSRHTQRSSKHTKHTISTLPKSLPSDRTQPHLSHIVEQTPRHGEDNTKNYIYSHRKLQPKPHLGDHFYKEKQPQKEQTDIDTNPISCYQLLCYVQE